LWAAKVHVARLFGTILILECLALAATRLERNPNVIHFTFNDGHGVEPGGAQDFDDLRAAKREALRSLVELIMEDDRTGEITATVAGADSGGKVLFSVRMHVTIEEAGACLSPARSS
jgi:hypothetical protein